MYHRILFLGGILAVSVLAACSTVQPNAPRSLPMVPATAPASTPLTGQDRAPSSAPMLTAAAGTPAPDGSSKQPWQAASPYAPWTARSGTNAGSRELGHRTGETLILFPVDPSHGGDILWSPAGPWTTLGGTSADSLELRHVSGEAITLFPSGSVDTYHGQHFRWSPDGRYLVYGRTHDLYLYDAKAHQVNNLTQTPGRWELSPSWSPQSDRLAFTSRPLHPKEGKPSKPLADPWVRDGCFCGTPTIIRPDGSGYRVLGDVRTTRPPSWSHDGTQLAYADVDANVVHVYDLRDGRVSIIDPADYGLPASWYLGSPAFSPTRNELSVFFAEDTRRPTREELMAEVAPTPHQGYAVLNLDELHAHIVYQYAAPFVSRPPAVWSSDGQKLALLFGQAMIITDPLGLLVVDRHGQRVEEVAPTVYQASWEPDGDRLAYLWDNELSTLSPTAQGWQRQTISMPVTERHPISLQGFSWRPAGR